MQSMPYILEKKRDCIELSKDDFDFICENISLIPREQLGAFLMACQINGLSETETAYLTKSMLNAGKQMEVSKNRVDKHSTGGVGDKMSIILAPALRACGATVPMLAGRGLAHTGGTIDKLEAIPGFNTGLSFDEMQTNPCFISRQTEDIAPADKILYSIRDITGTVPQIGLITASIISKKSAEGLEKLVLDVKCGASAFMKTQEDAKRLAVSMVKTGKSLGMSVTAQITQMDNPIGNMIGNSHEIVECIDCLKGRGSQDTMELVYSQADALGFNIRPHIENGNALNEFREMCIRQGVQSDVIDRLIDDPWSILPKSVHQNEITSKKEGYITKIDSLAIGRLLCELGAGRTGKSNDIDHGVGLCLLKKVGDYVKMDEVWAKLDCNSNLSKASIEILQNSISVSEIQPEKSSRIIEIIT